MGIFGCNLVILHIFHSLMKSLVKIILLIALVGFHTLSMEAKDFVVVLDAGHGGHDYGAIGAVTNEKSINLGVALKLGNLIKNNFSDVKVVYTRDGDYFKTLQERADIANKASGDLFISIHTNSVDKKSKNRLTVCGASTYTLGLHRSAENLDVAKRENAVMMLEDDYTTTYCGFDPNSTESYIIFELSQNIHMDQSIEFATKVQSEMTTTADRVDRGVRQAGFWVLAKTGMPAVLIELDFICNPTSEQFLGSESGQTKFANAIFNAFSAYKASYDRRSGNDVTTAVTSTKTPKKQKVETATVTEPVAPVATATTTSTKGEIRYKIQFVTSPTPLATCAADFKGITDYDNYYDGGLYKYTTGDFSSLADAKVKLREVRKIHNEAFIITTKDGKRIK